MSSVFETLYAINVNDHKEPKGKLTYLSWVWAWAEVKKRYPDASYKVYENDMGWNYHTDGRTAWVKTGVTINGQEHIEYLPIMDYKNNSIALEKVTSFDVNTAIQRSITKACARHGLGLYIYAGEDLPEDERPEEKKADKAKEKADVPVPTRKELIDKVTALCDAKGYPVNELCRLVKVNSLEELTDDRLPGALAFIEGYKAV